MVERYKGNGKYDQQYVRSVGEEMTLVQCGSQRVYKAINVDKGLACRVITVHSRLGWGAHRQLPNTQAAFNATIGAYYRKQHDRCHP